MPSIVYEDNHVLVAVKPPNMLSQADRTGDTDMLTELKDQAVNNDIYVAVVNFGGTAEIKCDR